MCTHATLWLKPPAPTTTRRRPAASASGLGVAGVASASATGGDQATPATSLPLAEQSFNSSLDPTRPPDHEPADAMLMHTSLPAKGSRARVRDDRGRVPGLRGLAYKGQRRRRRAWTKATSRVVQRSACSFFPHFPLAGTATRGRMSTKPSRRRRRTDAHRPSSVTCVSPYATSTGCCKL